MGQEQKSGGKPLERLKNRPDFLAVQSRGDKHVRPGLVLQALKTSNSPPRVGFTVTKKLGTAVKRNRIKRRLRAAADQVLPGRVKTGYDLVIIGRAAAFDRDFIDLKEDLAICLKKLNL